MDPELKLRYYVNKVLKLHCAYVRGKQILAKPILLLAIIQSVEDKLIIKNEFPWGNYSDIFVNFKKIYEDLFRGYLPNEYQTPLSKPYFHLKYEGFWHLQLNETVDYPKVSSIGFLNKNVRFAFLDEQLWELLQNPINRNYLREIVTQHYLKKQI